MLIEDQKKCQFDRRELEFCTWCVFYRGVNWNFVLEFDFKQHDKLQRKLTHGNRIHTNESIETGFVRNGIFTFASFESFFERTRRKW